MRYVGVGRRFVAIFVDGLIIGAMAGPFADIQRGPGYFRVEWQGGHAVWPGAIAIVYYLLLEGVAGATIGKFATGIRVVKGDGSKLDWSGAVIRNVARLIDVFPYVFPYLVGAIAVWSSPTKQRLGDRWANTVVVTKDSVPIRGSMTYPSGAVSDRHLSGNGSAATFDVTPANIRAHAVAVAEIQSNQRLPCGGTGVRGGLVG